MLRSRRYASVTGTSAKATCSGGWIRPLRPGVDILQRNLTQRCVRRHVQRHRILCAAADTFTLRILRGGFQLPFEPVHGLDIDRMGAPVSLATAAQPSIYLRPHLSDNWLLHRSTCEFQNSVARPAGRDCQLLAATHVRGPGRQQSVNLTRSERPVFEAASPKSRQCKPAGRGPRQSQIQGHAVCPVVRTRHQARVRASGPRLP